MNQRQPIRGTVALVLGPRELVFNRGRQDGVTVGMHFAVLDPRTQNVKDPETGLSLGDLYLPKVKVEVVRTEDHLSLARTYEVRPPSPTSLLIGGRFSGLFAPEAPDYVTFGPSSDSGQIDEKESIVQRGDPIE